MIFQLVPLDEVFHVLVPDHSYLTSHDIVLFGTKVSSTFYPGPGLPPPFRSALFVVISEERLSSSSSSPFPLLRSPPGRSPFIALEQRRFYVQPRHWLN